MSAAPSLSEIKDEVGAADFADDDSRLQALLSGACAYAKTATGVDFDTAQDGWPDDVRVAVIGLVALWYNADPADPAALQVPQLTRHLLAGHRDFAA